MILRRHFMSGASGIAFVAGALFAAVPALAQDETAPQAGNTNEAIVVTGSRIQASGFEAPTPVTVVTTEQLQVAAPNSLGDSLNQLPIFRNSQQPSSTGVGTTGNVGQSFLNLRGLGPQRTLILLDGRRIVPSTSAGTTDISILPESIVSRVDVVTGGASAAYGSDAVAGVVNFVLDTNFTGLKINASAGTAEEGDHNSRRLGIAGGASLFGGRGHVIASANYFKNSGIAAWKDRDWYNSCARINNPLGGNGNPSSIIECGVHSAGFTSGGMIASGPLAGIEFGPGGVPQEFTYGSQQTALSMVGGSGEDHGANFPVIPQIERQSFFGYFGYDLTDNVTWYVDGLYAVAKAHYASTAPWEGQSSAYSIQRDNAYLDPSIGAMMDEAGVDAFPMWRYNYDFGLLTADSRNRTWRVSTGLKAEFGDWSLHAYYTHGNNNYYQTTLNNPIVNRLYNAADAVDDGTGNIVCRSTLTQPGNGCVPINLFGRGSPSAEALAYVKGTTWQQQVVKQDVAEVSVSGSPFELWAGPLSVAFGAGYRREESVQTVDPISQSVRQFTGGFLGWPTAFEGQLGGWERTNPQPLSGSYDVREVFGEVLVPLLRDSALGQSLDLNAAIRYTDYSTSGGVTTWKVGATYEPISDIRLRGTLSRDIRAANINELYTGATQGQGNLRDPAFEVGDPRRTPVVYVRTFGNPVLKPEIADTLTLGAVLQPSFLPGFSFSVDYFDIKIKDAIGTLGAQTTIDECVAGATQLCSLLHRDPNDGNVLVSVDTPYLNIAERTTRGIDFEAQYRTRFNNGNTLGVRALATYVSKLTTKNPGAPEVDRAGQTGFDGGGLAVPHWVANGSISFNTAGGFGLFLQERYIGPGVLDVTLPASILDPALNHVDSVFYTDMTLTQKVSMGFGEGSEAELFLTVNNLFDQDPPLGPQNFFVFGVAHGGTNPALFDLVGRQYTAGIRMKF